MDFYTLIGVTGGATVLIAFLLNNSKRLSDASISYDLMNTIGSFLLVTYALLIGSIPFAIINIVWGSVSLWDVIKYFSRRCSV